MKDNLMYEVKQIITQIYCLFALPLKLPIDNYPIQMLTFDMIKNDLNVIVNM